jgi:hypothetical protein
VLDATCKIIGGDAKKIWGALVRNVLGSGLCTKVMGNLMREIDWSHKEVVTFLRCSLNAGEGSMTTEAHRRLTITVTV